MRQGEVKVEAAEKKQTPTKCLNSYMLLIIK